MVPFDDVIILGLGREAAFGTYIVPLSESNCS